MDDKAESLVIIAFYVHPASISFNNDIILMLSPNPVLWPVGLLVKKDCKILSRILYGISVPLSFTLIPKKYW